MSSPKLIRQSVVKVDFRKQTDSEFIVSSDPGIRPNDEVIDPRPLIDWRKSERLFSKVFSNSPQPMSITTLAEGRYLDINESFLSILSYSRDEVINRTSLDLGIWKNSAQRGEMVRMLKRSGNVRSFETTLRGKEGQTVIWLSSADLIELNGEQCILVISNDITERKRAEESLKAVSARLIRAQEEERNRIARELHDSLNQKLALLCVDLQQFSQNHPETNLQSELNDLSVRLQDASSDVHGLSHRLHPSVLDHLGLVPAVQSLCLELSRRHGVRIEFATKHSDRRSENLDKEVALCAYRVIQEALTNVIKHGDTSRARVELNFSGKDLCFHVTDNGRGFDVSNAKVKGRLGLMYMEERCRLANGRLTIRSKPMRGTQIAVRIPVVLKRTSDN